MPADEEVSQQLELLFIYRRNLAQYLMQQAQLGSAYVSPSISNGIAETRQNIHRVKSILRNWGRNVEDHPDDPLSSSAQSDYNYAQQPRSSLSVEKSIERFDAEEATLIGDLAASAMIELHYQPLIVNDFKLAYHEMTSNAVEHGCTNADDVFHVKVNVTTQFTATTMLNPTGRKFDARSIIEHQRQYLMENPRLRRGRGLLRIIDLADTFAEAKNKEGIKVVFYKDRVTLDIQSKDGISIIKVVSGIYNPSLHRRLLSIVEKYKINNLILDLRADSTPTVTSQAIIDIDGLLTRYGRRLVVLIDIDAAILLPSTVIAYSWEDAINKLSGPKIDYPRVSTPSGRRCRYCGNVPRSSAKFCSKCGQLL
jgi:anti-sigma regulatory factor (Ser/Thr protein kinase)